MDIYLDMKDWIALARVFHGRDRDEASVELLTLLEGHLASGEIRLPVSRIHLLEFTKISNHDRRKRLAQALVRFSRGFVLKPAESVICTELTNWGRGETPTAENAIGRGLLAAMGDYETQARSLGVSASEVEFEDRVGDNPLSWLFALSQPDFATAAEHLHATAKRYVATVDSVRSRWASLRQPERLAFYARGVLDDILAALPEVPTDVRAAVDRLVSLPNEELVAAIEDLPVANVLVQIGEATARDLNQPTKQNDLWDLAFLSVALPYCDAVVTERTWAHHAAILGLDKRYSCAVLKKLTDLSSCIHTA